MKNDNWGLLRHGIVVYIDMPVEDIYQRLIADPEQIKKRPLLQGENPLETLRKLNAERVDKYMQADVHMEVREREREKVRVEVSVKEKEREGERVRVKVKVKEKERERERERKLNAERVDTSI
jgi:shikimate kinase